MRWHAGEFEKGGRAEEGDFQRETSREKGLRANRSENTKPEIAVPTACRREDTFRPIPDGQWFFFCIL